MTAYGGQDGWAGAHSLEWPVRPNSYCGYMASFTIRRAKPADFSAVGAVTVDAYVTDGFIAPASEYVSELADAEARSAATLLVAIDEAGRVLGTVTFCRYGEPYTELAKPGEAEFRMLAVAKSARGNGVGQALVQVCIDAASEAGDHGVVLSTQESMRAAHRIYQRLGFSRAPERDWEPVPGTELIAYYKPL